MRSVTVMVQMEQGDPGTKWDRVYLDSDQHWVFYLREAHRIDSIYIQK
ncbi:hypothetical protein ABZW11_16820 [Nonomuraea sp. NPDC004580]